MEKRNKTTKVTIILHHNINYKTKYNDLHKMETIKEKTEKVQGTRPEKTKQKISVTYTLKAIGQNAQRLKDGGIITEDELKIITNIQESAIKKYIGLNMFK